MVRATLTLVVCLVGLALPSLARAQDVPAPSSTPAPAAEDLQPREIGRAGTMAIGFAGFVDRVYSSDALLPTNLTLQADFSRFVTGHIQVRGGIVGSASFGGDSEDSRAEGVGETALHAKVGAFYYLKPQSMLSLYAGAEYWGQLTARASNDAGFVFGTGGVEAMVSSRAGFFVEAGFGIGLTRNSDEALRTRFQGLFGLRIKL